MPEVASQLVPVPIPADEHTNPNFATSRAEARKILAHCAANPIALTRPIFIVAGYHSPRFTIQPMGAVFNKCFTNRHYIHLVTSPLALSLESAAANTVAAIKTHAAEHAEIDIIGHSMGGIISRMIMSTRNIPRVRRVFTLATPHRGAIIAPYVAIDRAARQLKGDSTFLKELNSVENPPNTEQYFYARLYDWWVGAQNCAPPDHHPFWLDADTLLSRLLGHFSITRDERILADIIRRLRGETPLATVATQPPRH